MLMADKTEPVAMLIGETVGVDEGVISGVALEKRKVEDIILGSEVAGVDESAYDVDGQAPLHRAVFGNQADSVQALILSGADPNIPDAAGNTAIHVSCRSGY